MRVVVSDETGLVKRVDFGEAPDVKPVVTRHRSQHRPTAPVVATFDRAVGGGGESSAVLLGLADGSVERLDVVTGESAAILAPGTFAQPIVGLHGNAGRVVGADETGTVRLWQRKGDDPSAALGEPAATFDGSPHANRLAVCPDDDSLVALGGKDCDLRVWRLDDDGGALAFKSKNPKPDNLHVHPPKHITDIAFAPGHGGTQLAVGTAYKQVRYYDSRAKARPVYSVEPSEHAIRCVTVTPDGNAVIAGDVAGGLYMLDLRTGKRLAKLRGFAGACRAVSCHPTLDLVAACGLDRHVRVYSTATHRCVRSVYLKQRLTSVLCSSGVGLGAEPAEGHAGDADGKPDGAADDCEGEGEGDDDDVWAELDAAASSRKHKDAATLTTKPKRRKKHQ